MSLILKSNKAMLLKKLSSVVSGAVLELDFRDSTYKKNGNIESLGALLEKTTAGLSGKYDYYQEWKEVPSFDLRVSVDPDSLKKGMLLDSVITNLFLYSKNPVSQSITIDSTKTSIYVLSVSGKGSVKLTINGIVIGVATQFSPVSYSAVAGITKNCVFDVDGELDYVGFYATVNASERVTRVTTTTASVAYLADIVKIKQDILGELISTWDGCIVLKCFFPKDIFKRNLAPMQNGSILQIKNTGGEGIFVARQENGGAANLLRTSVVSERISTTDSLISTKNIYAVNFTKMSAKMAHNGALSSKITMSSFTPTDIFIGSGDAWSTNVMNYVEQVLLFNRQLTDEELLEITSHYND